MWFFLPLGVAAALLFWYLVSLFYAWTYKPSAVVPAALVFPQQLFGDTAKALHPPRIHWLESPFFFLKWSCAGYAKSDKGPVWELHFLSALALIGFFLLYLFLYPFTAPVVSSFPLYAGAVITFVIVVAFLYTIWNADTTSSKWAPRVKLTFQVIPVLLLGSYVLGVVLNAKNVNGPNLLEMAFPTLASILVIATFILWLLSGLGFFFDRYRIPVLIIFLLALFLELSLPKQFGCSKGEHYYSAEPLRTPTFPPSPAEVLQLRDRNLNEPDIIVTASGGGIHAAAWTAQVMSRLEASFANDQLLHSKSYTFHDHIILASGVSGGSVGLMPYLLEYAARDEAGFKDFNNSQFHARITNPVACSDLEAIAWGLEYYDLYRLLFDFVPRLSPGEALDRSWALSTAFRRNVHDPHCFGGS